LEHSTQPHTNGTIAFFRNPTQASSQSSNASAKTTLNRSTPQRRKRVTHLQRTLAVGQRATAIRDSIRTEPSTKRGGDAGFRAQQADWKARQGSQGHCSQEIEKNR
jgi:hypothetical protein